MFISKHLVKIGDRVQLTMDINVPLGTFTKGHFFKVLDIVGGELHPLGYDLLDDDGREARDVLANYFRVVS